jgi:hypothetical protein
MAFLHSEFTADSAIFKFGTLNGYLSLLFCLDIDCKFVKLYVSKFSVL